MNLNLRQVRAFLAVARLGSFTRAAQELHLSQPALTVQIRQLEEEFGITLFDRNTRSVEITRAGLDLVQRLKRIQEDLEDVVAQTRDLAAGVRGTVRLACLQSFASTVLPRAVRQFRQQHPGIGFAIKDVSGNRILAMVRANEVDFGITEMPPDEPQIEFIALAQARLQVVLPPAHPLCSHVAVRLSDLVDVPLILMDRETSARRLVDRAFAMAGCSPRVSCEVVALATALAMVRLGDGVTVLPVAERDASMHSGVVIRPIDGPTISRWTGIVRRTARTLPVASEAFIAALLSDWKDLDHRRQGKAAVVASNKARARSPGTRRSGSSVSAP